MTLRSSQSGFVLWDGLIAFAIVAIIVSAIVVSLPKNSKMIADRLLRYEGTEFAFSKIEEYRVTFPNMQTEGTESSGWSWSVSEKTIGDTEPPSAIELVEITVTAWHTSRRDLSAILTAIVARRRL